MTTTFRPITGDTTLNEAVSRFPDTLPVFAGIGADTCCGGAKPIAEVARRHGADEADLLARLNRIAALPRRDFSPRERGRIPGARPPGTA